MVYRPSVLFTLWKRAFALIFEASPGYTVCWIALLVGQGVVPVAIAYLTKFAIDSITQVGSADGQASAIANTVWYLVLMGLALLAAEVMQHISSLLRIAHAEVFGDFLADKIHAKAGEVDLEFYESPKYHDLAEQVRGEAGAKPIALLDSFGTALQSLIGLTGLAALLLTYGWWLAIVLVVGAVPALYLTLLTDRGYHRWWRSTAESRRWTSYYDAMLTHANAAAEVRLFGLNSHFRKLYQTTKRGLRNEKFRHFRRQVAGKIAASVIALSVGGGVVIWMAVRVLNGAASYGDLGAFYQIFSRGQGLVSALFNALGKTLNNTLYLESLFAFLDLPTKIAPRVDSPEAAPTLKSGINFKSVSFAYPGSERPAIDGLDLFVPARSVVALVGVNGAGKSTLIKLLCRFYDPTSGAIEFDGRDLRDLSPADVRRMISVLFQFPMQYHASARENIAYGDLSRPVTDSEIEDSARKAGAVDLIRRLPEEFDTLLGKWFVNGEEISGGEWQRVALARAYYRKASIIVLDEPTSFMDSWSEADWFDRFRELAADRTGIVITHRFTIAMRADLIHVIDDGRIIESGNHQELLELDGFYAKSWNSQMLAARKQDDDQALVTEPVQSLATSDLQEIGS